MSRLDVLRQPANTLSVTLSHHNGAHKDLDRPDSLEWDLALACRLIEAEFVSELVLGDGIWICEDVSIILLQASF